MSVLSTNPADVRPMSTSPRIVTRRLRATPMAARRLREQRILAPFIGNYEADVFRTLRTLVTKRLAERGARTLGVCSAREGEGKSLVAMNLAISLSLVANHTVLLVELDFRAPHLHKTFGIDVKKGLTDVLRGKATISECLVDIGYERLTVLPAREPLSRSSETIASPAMVALAKELRDRYSDRLVIYDLPPILLSDDFLAFMDHLETFLFVAGEGRTARPEIERALSLLDPAKMIGSVLNAARTDVEIPKYYDDRR